jgi:signal transduction histidine kinase
MMTLASVFAFLRTPGIVRKMLVMLAAGFVLLVIAAAASIWSVARTREYNQLVNHTHRVIEATAEISSLTVEAESGSRGFMITRDPSYLDRYAPAVAVLPERISRLQAMVADNPEQAARARALAEAVRERLETLRLATAIVRSNQMEAAHALARTGRGRTQMIAIRDLVEQMRSAERTLLAERTKGASDFNRVTVAVNLASLALIALVAIASVVVIRRYVVELQASRSELDKVNRGLEDTVAERTEALVSANEEIQRFAYIVSHDLRAPLVNVMGYTSELQTAGKHFAQQIDRLQAEAPHLIDQDAVIAVHEDVPEAIDFIRASTAKMDRLINAILKLSREGRRAPVPERIEMTGLLQAIAASLSHQTSEANAEVVVDRLPPLTSDRLSIEQIFGNLLDNAVKFLDRTRPGLIRVTGEVQGPLLVYKVQDNGRGIADKDRERVFELFRRAGTQDRPGEGLGLAFVRNSVRRLGGVIDLQSEPGQGSTFTLKFPKGFVERAEDAE